MLHVAAYMMFVLTVYLELLFVFFFFQAEDGIRDLIVTGVQTCALPISLEAAQCRGELILLSAGDPRLDGLEIPRLLGDLALGQVVGARQRQGADQRDVRSEERRVGKECRSRWSPYH